MICEHWWVQPHQTLGQWRWGGNISERRCKPSESLIQSSLCEERLLASPGLTWLNSDKSLVVAGVLWTCCHGHLLALLSLYPASGLAWNRCRSKECHTCPWWQTLNSKPFYFQTTSLLWWFCAVPGRGRGWFRFRGTVCCLWVTSVTIWFSDLHSVCIAFPLGEQARLGVLQRTGLALRSWERWL